MLSLMACSAAGNAAETGSGVQNSVCGDVTRDIISNLPPDFSCGPYGYASVFEGAKYRYETCHLNSSQKAPKHPNNTFPRTNATWAWTQLVFFRGKGASVLALGMESIGTKLSGLELVLYRHFRWRSFQKVRTARECRGESNLGLCMTSGLFFLSWDLQRECCRAVATFNEFCSQTRFQIGSRHCTTAFSLKAPKSCTDLHLALLYIIIYSTFLRKNTMPAAGVCFPQPCSSAGRRFAPSRSRLDYFRTIGSFLQKTNWMKRFANWILLPVNTQVSSNRSCAGTLVLWSPKVHGSWNYLPYGTNGSR